ncbi:hypothetical protein Drose_05685 [Dactylosporangium roseum]|uniref:Uncharacterized protein n=1 Tax=Dactylosporangium roseum TaxID=47989 RepID=A0ABY5Z6T4_9ACTN|nr:hypothetical protein [Dactylosporangium roseum]UWZ37761.1 hypothetical protein Drose_05685 [Dactylosporangium roseum]
MSADARVARAIQQVRRIERLRQLDPYAAVSPALLAEYESVVDELIAEVKDALVITEYDIEQA